MTKISAKNTINPNEEKIPKAPSQEKFKPIQAPKKMVESISEKSLKEAREKMTQRATEKKLLKEEVKGEAFVATLIKYNTIPEPPHPINKPSVFKKDTPIGKKIRELEESKHIKISERVVGIKGKGKVVQKESEEYVVSDRPGEMVKQLKLLLKENQTLIRNLNTELKTDKNSETLHKQRKEAIDGVQTIEQSLKHWKTARNVKQVEDWHENYPEDLEKPPFNKFWGRLTEQQTKHSDKKFIKETKEYHIEKEKRVERLMCESEVELSVEKGLMTKEEGREASKINLQKIKGNMDSHQWLEDMSDPIALGEFEVKRHNLWLQAQNTQMQLDGLKRKKPKDESDLTDYKTQKRWLELQLGKQQQSLNAEFGIIAKNELERLSKSTDKNEQTQKQIELLKHTVLELDQDTTTYNKEVAELKESYMNKGPRKGIIAGQLEKRIGKYGSGLTDEKLGSLAEKAKLYREAGKAGGVTQSSVFRVLANQVRKGQVPDLSYAVEQMRQKYAKDTKFKNETKTVHDMLDNIEQLLKTDKTFLEKIGSLIGGKNYGEPFPVSADLDFKDPWLKGDPYGLAPKEQKWIKTSDSELLVSGVIDTALEDTDKQKENLNQFTGILTRSNLSWGQRSKLLEQFQEKAVGRQSNSISESALNELSKEDKFGAVLKEKEISEVWNSKDFKKPKKLVEIHEELRKQQIANDSNGVKNNALKLMENTLGAQLSEVTKEVQKITDENPDISKLSPELQQKYDLLHSKQQQLSVASNEIKKSRETLSRSITFGVRAQNEGHYQKFGLALDAVNVRTLELAKEKSKLQGGDKRIEEIDKEIGRLDKIYHDLAGLAHKHLNELKETYGGNDPFVEGGMTSEELKSKSLMGDLSEYEKESMGGIQFRTRDPIWDVRVKFFDQQLAKNGLDSRLEAYQRLGSRIWTGKWDDASLKNLGSMVNRVRQWAMQNPAVSAEIAGNIEHTVQILTNASSTIGGQIIDVGSNALARKTAMNLVLDGLLGHHKDLTALEGERIVLTPEEIALADFSTYAPELAGGAMGMVSGNIAGSVVGNLTSGALSQIPVMGPLIGLAVKGAAGVLQVKVEKELAKKISRDHEVLANSVIKGYQTYSTTGDPLEAVKAGGKYVLKRELLRDLGHSLHDLHEGGLLEPVKRFFLEKAIWWSQSSIGEKLWRGVTQIGVPLVGMGVGIGVLAAAGVAAWPLVLASIPIISTGIIAAYAISKINNRLPMMAETQTKVRNIMDAWRERNALAYLDNRYSEAKKIQVGKAIADKLKKYGVTENDAKNEIEEDNRELVDELRDMEKEVDKNIPAFIRKLMTWLNFKSTDKKTQEAMLTRLGNVTSKEENERKQKILDNVLENAKKQGVTLEKKDVQEFINDVDQKLWGVS